MAAMGFDPMAVRGTPPFEDCDSMLALAEQAGLGTRNLARIEVIGPKISEVRFDFASIRRQRRAMAGAGRGACGDNCGRHRSTESVSWRLPCFRSLPRSGKTCTGWRRAPMPWGATFTVALYGADRDAMESAVDAALNEARPARRAPLQLSAGERMERGQPQRRRPAGEDIARAVPPAVGLPGV